MKKTTCILKTVYQPFLKSSVQWLLTYFFVLFMKLFIKYKRLYCFRHGSYKLCRHSKLTTPILQNIQVPYLQYTVQGVRKVLEHLDIVLNGMTYHYYTNSKPITLFLYGFYEEWQHTSQFWKWIWQATLMVLNATPISWRIIWKIYLPVPEK